MIDALRKLQINTQSVELSNSLKKKHQGSVVPTGYVCYVPDGDSFLQIDPL